MRLMTILLFASLSISPAKHAGRRAIPPQSVTGRVFHDTNGNGRFDDGEALLSGLRVSNGTEIVHTNAQGRYRLPIGDDSIIFVIKPRGWQVPLSHEQLPRFYYIHKPAGSPALKYGGVAPTGPLPESVDFPLYPQEEPEEFQAILFGDTQPRNQEEVDYLAHDVVEELIGTKAAFGVTLGDIVFDDLSVFESYTKTVALVGIPWYNVLGNHDMNYDADDDKHSDESFERVFGPSYYSFDYGPAHFIVLDDVEWVVTKQENGETKKSYRGGLGEEQMTFIRNDLALIPEDQLVVLMMHIPLVDVHDRHELYRLIEQRRFCLSISGHTHYQEHRFIDSDDGWRGPEPHHHIINVTACGSWWSGAPDERGIPHTMMRDGAPNGYGLIRFDGHAYRWEFKAAARPASYQMNIHAPEVVAIDAAEATPVLVNVFGGSERSTVELRLGRSGSWIAMQRVAKEDPYYRKLYDEEQGTADLKWRKLPEPIKSAHLWEAPLPRPEKPGTYLIHVRTTDMFGKTYRARRVVRVAPTESDQAE